MYDLSDEATGLPPLREILPEDAMYALAWQIGPEGLVTHRDGESTAVKYLSVRGLLPLQEADQSYAQIHVAFPADAVRRLCETWLELLDREDRGESGFTGAPRPDPS